MLRNLHTPRLGRSAIAFALAAAGGLIFAEWPSTSAAQDAPQGQVIAFEHATIETMDKQGRLENATLVVEGDKILAIGNSVTIPATARRIDAEGKTILPGFVDPYLVVRIGSGPVEEFRVVEFRGRTFRIPTGNSVSSGPFTRVAENLYPYDLEFNPLRRSGITTAQVVSQGHGQSALANITPDRPGEIVLNPDGFLYLALTNETKSLNQIRSKLGSGRSGRSGGAGGGPASRGGRGAPGRGGPATGSGGRPAGGSSSLEAELWQAVAKGEKPLVVNVDNAAAILYLLDILKPHPEVQLIVIATGSNIYETVEALKERELTLVLKPELDTVPYSEDRLAVPVLVQQADIPFVFSLAVDNGQLVKYQDNPLLPVAYMVKCGLPKQVALEALTTRPAALLGLQKTHGSLSVGKMANFVIYQGDPWQPSGSLEQVWVEGRVTNDR